MSINPIGEKCPKCNSDEIKVKHTFIICHDCGYVIRRYGINIIGEKND